MFFRIKAVGSRRYLQIVENRRVGQATRQSVLATLGAVDALQASGKFDVLLRSGARLCDTTMLVMPSAAFICLMRRRMTPRDIGSRPTNGSS